PLPFDSLAPATPLCPNHSSVVGFRAHQENKLCFAHLLVHPSGPAFLGVRIILVDLTIDSVLAQAVRQFQDPTPMLIRIMAVADKNLRRFLFQASLIIGKLESKSTLHFEGSSPGGMDATVAIRVRN